MKKSSHLKKSFTILLVIFINFFLCASLFCQTKNNTNKLFIISDTNGKTYKLYDDISDVKKNLGEPSSTTIFSKAGNKQYLVSTYPQGIKFLYEEKQKKVLEIEIKGKNFFIIDNNCSPEKLTLNALIKDFGYSFDLIKHAEFPNNLDKTVSYYSNDVYFSTHPITGIPNATMGITAIFDSNYNYCKSIKLFISKQLESNKQENDYKQFSIADKKGKTISLFSTKEEVVRAFGKASKTKEEKLLLSNEKDNAQSNPENYVTIETLTYNKGLIVKYWKEAKKIISIEISKKNFFFSENLFTTKTSTLKDICSVYFNNPNIQINKDELILTFQKTASLFGANKFSIQFVFDYKTNVCKSLKIFI